MVNDIMLIYAEATGANIACTIQGRMKLLGYRIAIGSDAESAENARQQMVEAESTMLLCTPGVVDACHEIINLALKSGKKMVAVWPNNGRPWTWGDEDESLKGIIPFTLDMNGTDFELSLDKACAALPESVRERNAAVRGHISKGEWGKLLLGYPELIDICKLEKIEPHEWVDIVDVHPDLAKMCKWENFNGWDWRVLFRKHPEYADKCDWSKLSGGDWAEVLGMYPEFAEHCEWKKLDGMAWSELLCESPQFSDRCSWWKLGSQDWVRLLIAAPEFANKCEWHGINGIDWAGLLKRRPEFADKCEWRKLSGGDWARLLADQIEFGKYCDYSKLDANDWILLLKSRPDLAESCDFSLFTGKNWVCLLSETTTYQDVSGIITGRKDIRFLPARPEFAAKCDWTTLSGSDWVDLLKRHPEFAAHCDWQTLYDDEWEALLVARPELATHRPKHNGSTDIGRDSGPQDVATVSERGRAEDPICPCYDVFICSRQENALDAAERLGEALVRRGFAVYVDDGNNEHVDDALKGSRYFILMRSEGLFDCLGRPEDRRARQLRYALKSGKTIIPVAPFDRPWMESRSIPDEFIELDRQQIKNLDMENLFEEKVDAIIRDCMKGEIGQLNRKYDIFISYRRFSGAETARILQQELKARGYSVFLDYDSIRNGKYDQVIFSAIDSAPVFLMLMTRGSLDRCKDPDDWVAAEIVRAFAEKKCIVPVTPDTNFRYTPPPKMPERLAAVESLVVNTLRLGEGMSESLDSIEALFPEDLRERNHDVRERIVDANWVDLLIDYPELDAICDWKAFKDGDWAKLLEVRPQFADRCDWSSVGHYHSFGLNPYDCEWVRLLKAQPQFIRHCDISKLTPTEKAEVLAEIPELAKQNDWRGLCERSYNGVIHWVHILEQQPQFADHCDFSRFNGGDWSRLLRVNPSFADRCDFDKMSGADWVDLVVDIPQFADRCEWSSLEGKDWLNLLNRMPEFVDRCNWSRFEDMELCKLLERRPELAENCDWRMLNGTAAANLLAAHPEYADLCDWDVFDEDDWNILLKDHPEFWPHSERLSELHDAIESAEELDSSDEEGADVARLLFIWPEFADKVTESTYDRFSGKIWVLLLTRSDVFADKCRWDALDGFAWAALLVTTPEFAKKCDWEKLDEDLWEALLEERPELQKYRT